MQGIVFDQLRAYANSLGPEVWSALLKHSGIGPKSYLVSESYPDEELEALVGAATRLSERSRNEVLLDFGRFLTPGLLSIYGVFLDKHWGLREVLLNTESTIHRIVRLRDAEADPPHLRILEGPQPNQVSIIYDSPRRMCWLGKGIIEGLADEYRTKIVIRDVRCMHDNDPTCEMSVSIGPTNGTAPL